MIPWAIQIIAYTALAGIATRLAWRSPLGIVGLTLCLCSLTTVVTYFGSSFPSRLAIEVVQCIVIVTSARIAFAVDRGLSAIAIMGLAALDVAFCAVLPLLGWSVTWQSYRFGQVTNGVFACMCLFVAAPGGLDALVGRFGDRLSGGRLDRWRHALGASRVEGYEP